jgi:hypothetical protein
MDMKTQNWSSSAEGPVGLIIRQKDPNNLEMPFDQLSDFITPSELFYIRSHFPVPELDPVAFRLSIRGAVPNEISHVCDEISSWLLHIPNTELPLSAANRKRIQTADSARAGPFRQSGPRQILPPSNSEQVPPAV